MESALYKDPRDMIGSCPSPFSEKGRIGLLQVGLGRMYLCSCSLYVGSYKIRQMDGAESSELRPIRAEPSVPQEVAPRFFLYRGSQSDRCGTCEESGHAKHFESYAAPPSPTAEGDLRLPVTGEL